MISAMDGSRFAAALLDPQAPVSGLQTWNNSDPVQRFNVYRNNVVVSLIEALRVTFPVVEHLVGQDFFTAMAREHARCTPPRSPIMAQYGAGFPEFIARYGPAADVPYLADVARLEAARVAAYHAADAASLGPEDFARIPGEAISDLRLSLHPSLQIVCSPFAIVSLWAAHQGVLDIGDVDPDQPEDALILRPHDDVLVMTLLPGAADTLRQLSGGVALGDALLASTAHSHIDPVAIFRLVVESGAASAVALSGDFS